MQRRKPSDSLVLMGIAILGTSRHGPIPLGLCHSVVLPACKGEVIWIERKMKSLTGFDMDSTDTIWRALLQALHLMGLAS